MARKKKTLIDVAIHGIADKGRAVGRTSEGQVVFVEEAVPGDVVDVQLQRKRKGVWFGKVLAFMSRSEFRTEPVCDHFDLCGGCKWQNLDYKTQLVHKDQVVRNAIGRIGGQQNLTYLPILGADDIYHYRNKMEYTFSNKRWLTQEQVDSGEVFQERNALGFHRPGMFDKVVQIENCHLQKSPSNEIRNAVHQYALKHGLEYFDIKKQVGLLRNLVIRTSSIGETMIIVVFFQEHDENKKLMDFLSEQFPAINSLQYAINDKKNDSLQGVEVLLFKGKPFIVDEIGHVSFQIGPHSFFQTNSKQALTLFSTVKDFVELNGDEVIYDLYCGIGSIALFLANSCKKIIGIESVAPAIEDAEINKEKNQISNAFFETGDVKDLLKPSFVEKYGSADVIVTDPPRAGMHQDVVETLIQLKVPKLVYVSCNPATQARDLALLSAAYTPIKSQAVDMFPHTHHIENIVLLTALD